MLASGKIKKCYWHQLIAPGYGLVNNLNQKIVKRDAYYSFKYLIKILSGGKTKKLLREKNLFCFIVEKDDVMIEAIWSSKGIVSFKTDPSQLIFDMLGKKIQTKSSPVIDITGDVIYLKKDKKNYNEFNLKEISRDTGLILRENR